MAEGEEHAAPGAGDEAAPTADAAAGAAGAESAAGEAPKEPSPLGFDVQAAGTEMRDVLLQGQEMLAQGSALWQQGADAARDQWQHGAELCHRSMEHGAGMWKKAAPYLDHGIRITNLVGAILISGFMLVGLILIFTPLQPERLVHGSFDRMFWMTQGVYLMAWSTPALIATVQCGVLRSGFTDWPASLKVDLWLSVLKFQLGRALFFIFAGFYVFPLLDNFGKIAVVEPWMAYFSYFLGFTSILAGVFLLVFDVVLAVFVKGSISYSRVPDRAEEA